MDFVGGFLQAKVRTNTPCWMPQPAMAPVAPPPTGVRVHSAPLLLLLRTGLLWPGQPGGSRATRETSSSSKMPPPCCRPHMRACCCIRWRPYPVRDSRTHASVAKAPLQPPRVETPASLVAAVAAPVLAWLSVPWPILTLVALSPASSAAPSPPCWMLPTALLTHHTPLHCPQVRGPGAGLLASFFVAMVPSYISRSVGGSFDNEGVAIFALVNTFYWFIKVGRGLIAERQGESDAVGLRGQGGGRCGGAGAMGLGGRV